MKNLGILGLMAAAIFAIFFFFGVPVKSDTPSPWTFQGDDTYTGQFIFESGTPAEVTLNCVMVRNSSGMSKGASSVFCK